MKFICCGIVYSTQDPDTYQFIESFLMKSPTLNVIAGKQIEKELVYTLCCKKNGCFKLEIHRYCKEDGVLNLVMTNTLKGIKAINFMERTRDLRIKLPQSNPCRVIPAAKKVPWVYGKAVSDDVQVARYFDESGDRFVFKDQKWKKEVFKFDINTHTI